MQSIKLSGLETIPKFDGNIETYADWREYVKDIAAVNSIPWVIQNASITDSRFTDDERKIIDIQFMSAIKLCLSLEVRRSLRDEELGTSIELLGTLDRRYSVASNSSKFRLLQELLAFRQDGRTVSAMSNDYKGLLSRLKSTKLVLEDIFSLVYLNAFDIQYNVTVQVIGATDPMPSLDQLINRMLRTESDLLLRTPVDNAALKAEQTPNPPRPKPFKRCSHCKRSGHTFEECYMDGGGAEKRRPSWWVPRTTNMRYAGVSHCEDNETAFTEYEALLATNGSLTKKSGWIIDSGCSTTVTWDRAVFRTYYKSDGHITIGDGTRLPIIGK